MMNININDYIVSESYLKMEREQMRYMICLRARDEIAEQEKWMYKLVLKYFYKDEDKGNEKC